MARLTPNIGIKGAFLLKAPFATEADVEYTVVALRSIAEFTAKTGDPVELIYKKVGLGRPELTADQAEGAIIVVLSTKAGVLMYVPDTYILSYPFMGSIPYSHIILSVSLGMLPDDMDLTGAQQVVTSAVSDAIGVEPTVFISKGEVTDMIDEQRHVQLTISREAAIKNRETDRAKALRLASELQTANERIAEYELIIQQLSANQP